MIEFIVYQMVTLHGVDGREVEINPDRVTHLVSSKEGQEGKHFVEGIHCMVNFDDGKFYTVVETCDVVQQLIEEAHK
jgi:hypothetical protein